MTASSMTLRTFLATARSALGSAATDSSAPTLTFVVGNESAAVVLAYMRTLADVHTTTGGHQPRHLHIPLSNLPREDLDLRPEMATVLNHAGLKTSDLLTLSDLPDNLKSETSNGDIDEASKQRTRWLLVDHNALTGPLQRFADRVTGVIDHHVDEGAVPPDADPRIIEKSGSCMSLIVEQTKSTWESLVLAEAEQEKLARLSLAPVLIDTVALQNKDKTTPKDVAAAEFLEARIPSDRYSRLGYYEEVHSVKEDLSRLGLRDILRKDYKEWSGLGDAGSKLRLGISSVAQNLDWVVDEKAGGDPDRFADALAAWADERGGLDLASVTTSSNPQGEYQRNLLVWGRSEGGLAAFRAFLEEEAGSLQLETWRDGALDKGDERKAWRQYNLAASRKQIGPMLRDALGKGLDGSGNDISARDGNSRTDRPSL